MELTTTAEILSLFETNKVQRQDFIRKTIQDIEEGGADPLRIHLQIKAMEEIITGLTSLDKKKNKNFEDAKKYRDYLLEAAEKNGKEFEFHNSKFSIKETGTKYDYSQCGDTELADLMAQNEILSAKIKERQKFLQNIPEEGLTQVNEETGDVITLCRPVKSSTTSVTVQLK